MSLAGLLVLGLVIGSNNLGAALALGALGQIHRRVRIVAVFAAFEFVVPLVGLSAGRAAATRLEELATWLSAGLLIALGSWAIAVARRRKRDDQRLAKQATTWSGLCLLAGGLSADNLVVGFSLGGAAETPLVFASTIAVFSSLFAWVGIGLGNEMRRHWEQTAELASGGVLIILGIATAAGLL